MRKSQLERLSAQAIEIKALQDRIVELELALQNYMDAMRYADKETLKSAIRAADDAALLLIPKHIHAPAQQFNAVIKPRKIR